MLLVASFFFIRRDVYQLILGLGLPSRKVIAHRTFRMAAGQSYVISDAVFAANQNFIRLPGDTLLVLEESPVSPKLGADFLSSV
jgi:hypothetical protein